MEPLQVGIVGSIGLLVLIFIRVPIAYGLFGVGTLGLIYIYDLDKALAYIPIQLFSFIGKFTFATVPLFLFMGYLAFYAMLSKEAYDAARAWFGNVPGGLAITTVFASAIFGACCGSSLAECAVFSKIAIPEMLASKYNKKLALGVVASAGALAVLIPPSIIMIIYGVLTETSVGKLLVAGILPGLLYAAIFSIAIVLFACFKPSFAPRLSKLDTSWEAKLIAIKKVWGVALLFVIVIVPIYVGLATPDECAAVGVVGAFLLAAWKRELTWNNLKTAVIGTANASAMVFLLVGGASIFTTFLSVTGVVSATTKWLIGSHFPFWIFFTALVLLYVVLGMFLDSVSMMILTLPLITPVFESLNIDPIWFGVVMVMLVEIGCITPPMGLNVYVIKAALGHEVELEEIFAGALPFMFLMVLVILILVFFPEIALWLPRLMFTR